MSTRPPSADASKSRPSFQVTLPLAPAPNSLVSDGEKLLTSNGFWPELPNDFFHSSLPLDPQTGCWLVLKVMSSVYAVEVMPENWMLLPTSQVSIRTSGMTLGSAW